MPPYNPILDRHAAQIAADEQLMRAEVGEDFASTPIRELVGGIYDYAVTQHGSRDLQLQLESPQLTKVEFDTVFNELLPRSVEVMQSRFGNYVVQKLMERGGSSYRAALVTAMRGKVLVLAFDMYGCRVLQRALEMLDEAGRLALAREVYNNELKCVENQHANHVVQKCFETIPIEKISFIVKAFEGWGPRLAMHCFGCRVLQCMIEFAKSDEQAKVIHPVMVEIVSKVHDLVRDQYGNYVVQHVLIHGNPKPHHQNQIVQRLVVFDDIRALSRHKNASNVVEKIFEFASEKDRQVILDNLVPVMAGLLLDRFANYVVQKILRLCEPTLRNHIIDDYIRPYSLKVRSTEHGKAVMNTIMRMYSGDVGDPRDERARSEGFRPGDKRKRESEDGGTPVHRPVPPPAVPPLPITVQQ